MMLLLSLLCLLSSAFGPVTAQDMSSVVTVSEGEDAVLNCSSDGSINMFDWKKNKTEVFMYDRGKYYGHDKLGQAEQFRERVQFFKEELTSGNASIKIINTRLDDSGNYTCVIFRPDRTKLETLVMLNVVPDLRFCVPQNIRNIDGAAREPYTYVEHKGTWSLLTCSALGFPEPELEWINSTGEVQEHLNYSTENQNGQFHVTLQVKVTKSDNYTCVVTQKSINHKICSETHKVTIEVSMVTVSEGEDAVLKCSSTGSINMFDWKKGSTHVGMYNNGEETEKPPFIGRVEFFKEEVTSGNASIKIKKTVWNDTGTYTCVLFRPDGKKDRDVFVILNVARKPDIRVQHKGTWCLLTCSALVDPKPELEWINSAGEVQEHFKYSTENQTGKVTLQVKVTKSDNYTCVVIQKSINHKICSETQEVTIEGAGWIVAVAVLSLVIILTAMTVIGWCYKNRQRRQGTSGQQQQQQKS